MRRNEKEITDAALIGEILESNRICHVAFVDGDKPYIIPMNYGYRNKTIFLHSATEGKKIDIIGRNGNVCLEVSDSIEIKTSESACGFGTEFRSVICKGVIEKITDRHEKTEGLRAIMRQHTGRDSWDIPAAAVDRTAVYKIRTVEVTGKISG
ncbi:MAG: pyridoxamine 5'-phosphate oxidase family protein [Spirochaetales bacterium]|nr:pyridoxamine 5'-phosphate oxidase family protein [Spirochaetales bacterium]